MAKFTDDSIFDAACTERATATAQRVCAGQPVSVADAITKTLATRAITGGNFTIADGDVSGRKSTVDQATDISVSATGTADHVSLDDGTTLLEVTTCNSLALTSGGTVTVPAYDSEFQDPT